MLLQIDFNNLQGALPNFRFPAAGGLGQVIFVATQYIFIIAGLVLLFYLISGGFAFMTSGGDPGKLKEARATITHAILGFLLIFIAYWIIQLVGTIFGISDIQSLFGK